MPRLTLAAASMLSLLLVACSSSSSSDRPSPTGVAGVTPPAADGNLFVNPGFEGGRDPWFALQEPGFALSTERHHSGSASALLRMRDGADVAGDAKVYYLVQELNPAEFPETISGFYRVENWRKGTPKQYLQFVVIVFRARGLPGDYPNHQIRYPLAGIDEEPFAIENAHFVFLTMDEPVTDEWLPFSVNLGDDFRRLWGAVPQGWEKLRLLFEVRWDDKQAGQASEADVYYDDLYLGPAQDDAGS